MALAPVDVSRSFIVGITGGSGSGKTTLARSLQLTLGPEMCGILYQDSYYYDLSRQFDYDGGSVNFDHPSAIEFSLMVEHLERLKFGHDVEIPQYDFKTHSRLDTTHYFEAKPVILVDGILILTDEKLRQCLDLSVYVDACEGVRFRRRLERDVRERGRTPEGVHNQFFAQVKPMHDQFVEPMQSCADQVVSGEESFLPVIEQLKQRFVGFSVDRLGEI